MAQYDGSIRINTEIEYQNAKKELKNLESSIIKTAEKIGLLRSKMNALKDVQIPTQEYKEIESDISKAERELQKLIEKQSQMQRDGKDSGAAWDTINQKIQATKDYIEFAKEDMQQLVDAGKAFTLGSDTEKYAEISSQIEQLNQQMQTDTERQTELQGQIAEREEYLAQLRKNAVVGNQRIIETVERIRELEQEITDLKAAGITEGYQDYDSRIQELRQLKEEVKEYGNSVDEVKKKYSKLGQIASSVLSKIGNIVKKNALSSFKFLGKEIKKTASIMIGFGKNAKNTNNIFGAGFKSILKYGLGIRSLYALFNKLRSAIKEGYENLYNDNERFKNSVDSLKASALTLKNAFAAAFRPLVDIAIPYIQKVMDYMSELLNYVGQFIAALTGQKTYTKAIRQTAKAFKDAKKAAEGYLSPLDEINKYQTKSSGEESATGVMFEEVPIETRFENIADWFKKMWENADFTKLGTLLGEKLRDALNNIPWKDIKEKGKKIGKSLATLINGFVETEGLSESIGKTIGETINTGVSTAKSFIENTHFYEIGKFVAETANSAMKTTEWGELAETISLGIEGALDTAIGFLDNFDWEEFIQSIEEFLAGIDWGGILGRLGLIILEVFRGVFTVGNKLGADLTSTLAEFFRSIGWDSVAGFLEGMSEQIEFYGKAGKFGFEKVIQWVKDSLGIHSPSTIFADIGKYVVEGFINGLSDLKDKVVEVFNQVKEAAKTPINAIISLVETLANSVIEGINVVIGALNGLNFNIPDWIPGIGGESLGFNIPEFSKVSIPRLATGAVIPANREFLAVLGDQKHGTNIEAPLDTLMQANEQLLLNVLSKVGTLGGAGGTPVNLTLQVVLDSKVIGQTMVDWGKIQQIATGKNPYELGTT